MIENLVVNENLIDNNIGRDTSAIENEMTNFLGTEEGEKIKSDVELLKDMGYDKKMINKVYILLRPENIERAVDFMTEINGVYQHNFFENHNPLKDKGLCFICKKSRQFHLDYIPAELLADDDNQNINLRNNFIEEDNDSFNFSAGSIKSGNGKIEDEKKNLISNECNVCFDEVEEGEKNFNALPCGHICCTQCWTNYLKTLITEAKVEHIKCVDHQCKEIISEEFILNHIKDDNKLVDKYNKFKKRALIIGDKNKKQCPKPDCDSFLEKSTLSKYVKCEHGHKYCFECLKPPHGTTDCDALMEKELLKWTKNKRVKRCPRCRIYTEKNEGCNHMTCVSCKYQWCWLCEGKYSYDHYRSGKCQGLQFVRADNLKQAHKAYCGCTLHSILPCFFPRDSQPPRINSCILRYVAIFVTWIFGFFIFAGYTMVNIKDDFIINSSCAEGMFYFFGVFIALSLFTCFQILFACLITPLMIVSFVYPIFILKILHFLCIVI